MKPLLRGLFSLTLFLAGIFLGAYAVRHWDEVRRQADADLPPRVWQATVYLPLVDNAGKPFPDEHWHQAVEIFVAYFGGATLEAPQDGRWLDADARVHRERVRPVIVSFERDRLDDFRRAVREVGVRLGQEAMYVRLEEPRIELISVGAERTEKDP